MARHLYSRDHDDELARVDDGPVQQLSYRQTRE
jgi:hypothetical protein